MLTGDDDTDMEVFLFQMGILVAPFILGVMGYDFTLNTSTLLVFLVCVTVGVRFGWRCYAQGELVSLWCSEETLESLEQARRPTEAGEKQKQHVATALEIVLGVHAAESCSCKLGEFLPPICISCCCSLRDPPCAFCRLDFLHSCGTAIG